MAEPPLGPVAEHVRRYDPGLFRTALFAREPGRGRLMTLYAFDIELSRALSRSREPMISLMRLQWWRDILGEIAAREPARAHEVAGPLHAQLSRRPLPADLLEGLVAARELELQGLATEVEHERWAELRFAGLTRLASLCLLEREADNLAAAAGPAGQALGIAFSLRTALPMAGEGRPMLLPGLNDSQRAELARGAEGEGAMARLRDLAKGGLAALARARERRSEVPAAATPAFLPLTLAAPVLHRAARPGSELAELAGEERGFGSVRLLWRAATGRW